MMCIDCIHDVYSKCMYVCARRMLRPLHHRHMINTCYAYDVVIGYVQSMHMIYT